MCLLKINLRHLETKNLVVRGDVPAADLDLAVQDELVRVELPVAVDLEAQRMDGSMLVQGVVVVTLSCECARCLRPFQQLVELDPYDLLVPLEGEDAVKPDNDSVDLTPFLREDILLGFPQHPLCEADCGGLARKLTDPADQPEPTPPTKAVPSSAWSELNKLKF